MTERRIAVERADRVAVATLNHPPLNVLSVPMLEELDRVLAGLGADPTVGAVVIWGGQCRAFAAGADISTFTRLSAPEAERLARQGQDIYQRIADLPKPVIAAVHGVALGGGCELALACDFRIAALGSRLGLPEVTLGALPGWGGTQRLPRLVGTSQARWMIMTGEPVGAEEALRIGLVDRVMPEAELLEAARAMAAVLAGKAPQAVALIKQAMAAEGSGDPEAGLAQEARLFGRLFATDDFREGVTAFLEKRRPHWNFPD